MKKSTKGAVAAGAAAVLLLGGVGSLAYWSDSKTIDGGSIESGELSLTPATPAACTNWKLDGGTDFGTTSKIVPGDTLTKVCTYAIEAQGDHLKADLTVDSPAYTGTNALIAILSDPANTTATYTVGSTSAPTQITSADDGKDLVATITVNFPYGGPVSTPPVTDADNTTKGLAAALNDITISAVQVHS